MSVFFFPLVASANFAQNMSDEQIQSQTIENIMTDKKNPKIVIKIAYSEAVNDVELSKDDAYGKVVIELYPDKAAKHVERILTLANKGFYDGLKFHRVIDGFMVQTGDPLGDGTGGSDLPNLNAEFNDLQHKKGVMSMARATDPNSANSQFFIMLADADYLDHQYTAFGKVIEGMENVEKIKKGSAVNNGAVSNPDFIRKMYVLKEDASASDS